MIFLGLFWMCSHVKITDETEQKLNTQKNTWTSNEIQRKELRSWKKSKKYSPCHPQKRQFPKNSTNFFFISDLFTFDYWNFGGASFAIL